MSSRRDKPMQKLIQQLGLTALLFGMGHSAIQAQSLSDFSSVPPLSKEKITNPMILLTLSNDHQVYFKAYNDYDDLDGDGTPETTYSTYNEYVGYFDSQKCYSYANGLFSPSATLPTSPGENQPPQYCAGSLWSGNFLNWATMTRIDVVRYVLYGGKRVTDTASQTILERSYLPNDAHSFAKYYDGSDLNNLTPYSIQSSCSADDTDCRLNHGYTFCNTTLHQKVDGIYSQDVTQPPLVRVVPGNYSLWASSERYQCLYRESAEGAGDSEMQNLGDNVAGSNGNFNPAETGIYAHGIAPRYGAGTDYIVRVEVCGTNGTGGSHDCKTYDNGTSSKPIGILQRYGEDDTTAQEPVRFGLLTGNYNSTKQFGVLRKRISSFNGEVNPDTGQFVDNVTNSMIDTLDAFRIVDYQYYSESENTNYYGTYNQGTVVNGVSQGACGWGNNAFSNGDCRNWGNPFGELLAQSYRYFAGAGSPLAPGNSDANLIPGLSVETMWDVPVEDTAQNACASLNVIGFNSSYISYDHNFTEADGADGGALTVASLLGNANIPGSNQTLAALTDSIGQLDRQLDFTNSQYFVGSLSGATAESGKCTPKTISNLSDTTGVCPEAPRLEGSYLGAGLSYFVHTNDVLPNTQNSINTIETIGVKMAGTLPRFSVPFGSEEDAISVLPACSINVGGVATNCAIVDFKVLERTADGTRGRYFVAWEDSEQGGDFDTDINGLLAYRIDGSMLYVYTRVFHTSTDLDMGLGFVIAGTGNDALDGYYTPSGTFNFTSGFDCEALGAQCVANSTDPGFVGWQRVTFDLSTANTQNVTPVKELEGPLYFASKWGFFEDSHDEANIANIPDIEKDWDKNEDGSPDSYLLVTNPTQLKVQIEYAIAKALLRPRTSTSAAVSTLSVTGEGLTLHTLYYPEYAKNGRSVSWVSTLNGLFSDEFGNTREDSNGNGILDATDLVVEFVSDEENTDTLINRYNLDATTGLPDRDNPVDENVDVSELNSLWDAHAWLSSILEANIQTNRVYGNTSRRRYIFTAVEQPDGNNDYDGQITKDDLVVDFEANEVAGPQGGSASELYYMLDASSEQHGQNIVNFVRGVEVNGMRSRKINFDGSGEKVWRLGDIINSTPAVVGRPSEPYDVLYGDNSYRAFRDYYRNRRQMVYVGANDGLLHAFNAGFFNPSTLQYSRTGDSDPNATEVGTYELGAELWAYAPYNLLPHLKWLTQPEYDQNRHVYYMDSEVQKFDVNIFNDDDDHPYGWGTIIVVGMRLGGNPYALDPDGDGTRGEMTARSAYMIFDVTNPEEPPELLGEITHPELGHAMGKVGVMKQRVASSTGSYADPSNLQQNDWFLVFGSGPRGAGAITEGVSDQPAKIFTLNLNDLAAADPEVTLTVTEADDMAAESFVGGLAVTDWDRNYKDDMVYFGLIGDGTNSRGALKHVSIANNGAIQSGNLETLLTGAAANAPFSSPPLPVVDREGNYWLYAGTGRFMVQGDLDHDSQESYFGFKVNNPSNPTQWLVDDSIAVSNLKDVSKVDLYYDREVDQFGRTIGEQFVIVDGSAGAGNEDEYASYDAYLSALDAVTPALQGWYFPFENQGENQFARSAFNENTVVFSAFLSEQSCEPSGASTLYAVDMFTGLPQYRLTNVFSTNESITRGEGDDSKTFDKLTRNAGTVDGVASDTIIANNKAFTKNDLGETTVTDLDPSPGRAVRRSWREISLDEIN